MLIFLPVQSFDQWQFGTYIHEGLWQERLYVHALFLFSTATDTRPVVVRRTMITKHGSISAWWSKRMSWSFDSCTDIHAYMYVYICGHFELSVKDLMILLSAMMKTFCFIRIEHVASKKKLNSCNGNHYIHSRYAILASFYYRPSFDSEGQTSISPKVKLLCFCL